MKNISNNKILGSIMLVMALVFVAGLAGAPAAHAQYYNSPYNQGCYSGSCGYYGTPTYSYPPVYTSPPVQQYAPLYASCYPQPLTIQSGQTAQWMTSLSGGNGVYNVSWSGDEGLSGYGSSISKSYYSPGFKNASVTVTSGGQTISANCSGSVNVQGTTNYYYPPTTYNTSPTYYYNTAPTYYNTTGYYNLLQVSCNSNTSIASIGSAVNWLASVSGGNGVYTYSWSGTDGIYGYNQSIVTTYNTPGQKIASVTVYSNGQTVTQNCSSSVNVGGYQNSYIVPVVASNNNNSLDIGCYADPATVSVNQPVTWNAEVTGGVAPYTYSWTGSDGLNGSQSSVIKYYSSAGQKDAIVSITSADGKTGTRACTDSLAVHGNGGGYAAPTAPVQQVQPAPAAQQQNSNGLSASALFSLSNLPWGWVAVLVILVLFGTVMYLVFNRPKI